MFLCVGSIKCCSVYFGHGKKVLLVQNGCDIGQTLALSQGCIVSETSEMMARLGYVLLGYCETFFCSWREQNRGNLFCCGFCCALLLLRKFSRFPIVFLFCVLAYYPLLRCHHGKSYRRVFHSFSLSLHFLVSLRNNLHSFILSKFLRWDIPSPIVTRYRIC
ncbi:hypothetical protein L873DRAFT_511707 [Choiromyces venosus 120613-1]|uniref:Uncharacterized protein n=1 Tax=Choiromyces venosus 120613-1 TaxID=1336337 RepID=A0A3N4IYH8_9PEZI|nr:hypothetical protein L873DRAFT_511707 [Choiromyces venosus 120613-1]